MKLQYIKDLTNVADDINNKNGPPSDSQYEFINKYIETAKDVYFIGTATIINFKYMGGLTHRSTGRSRLLAELTHHYCQFLEEFDNYIYECGAGSVETVFNYAIIFVKCFLNIIDQLGIKA